MEHVLSDGQLPGIRTATESESVSALEFCSVTLNLAIGSSSGLVRAFFGCLLIMSADVIV